MKLSNKMLKLASSLYILSQLLAMAETTDLIKYGNALFESENYEKALEIY